MPSIKGFGKQRSDGPPSIEDSGQWEVWCFLRVMNVTGRAHNLHIVIYHRTRYWSLVGHLEEGYSENKNRVRSNSLPNFRRERLALRFSS
jgi:hypothetical protein